MQHAPYPFSALSASLICPCLFLQFLVDTYSLDLTNLLLVGVSLQYDVHYHKKIASGNGHWQREALYGLNECEIPACLKYPMELYNDESFATSP